MSTSYKVLVIAGGGIFGAIPAALLAGKFKEYPLLEKFDCFAGTSVGGMLAMCYASGTSAQNVLHDFKTLGRKAFPKMPWWWRCNPFRTKYDNKPIEEVLRNILPMTLGELKAPVIVPTIDFQNNRPKVFDNLVKNEDHGREAWAVARATSAAPTYFPPFGSFIDGGLMANLPILETAAALNHKLGIKYEDMEFMVVGTGRLPDEARDMRKVRHWSRLHWVFPLLHFMVRANELRSAFIAKQLGLGKLVIFNPVVIEPDWEMDRVDLIPIVESMAEQHDKEFEKVYEDFCR